MERRTFTREFKLDVVRQITSGEKRPSELCREHQLAESLLARWRHEVETYGELAFTPGPKSEIEALERCSVRDIVETLTRVPPLASQQRQYPASLAAGWASTSVSRAGCCSDGITGVRPGYGPGTTLPVRRRWATERFTVDRPTPQARAAWLLLMPLSTAASSATRTETG